MSKKSALPRKEQSAPRKIAKRKREPLLVNGVSALVAGGALWALSLVIGDEASLKVASRALLAPAWMALALGVALLLLHVVIKRRTRFEAAMLLRQHSQFHEPMPPVVRVSSRRPPAPDLSGKRRQSLSTD